MKKMLVVDDNKIVRIALRETLSDTNFTVIEAENGEEAYNLWISEQPEIVIVDLEMPVMNGYELVKKIRKSEQTRYTFIIALTANHDQIALENSFEYGVDDFLVKPISSKEFLYRVKVGERTVEYMEKESLIYVLASLTEARDLVTGNHIKRISAYTKLLTQKLMESQIFPEIDYPYITKIEIASILHDIGKISMPDHLLKSSHKYTQKDKELMESHTTIGAKLIKDIYEKFPHTKFLEMAHDIALHHHEKYDGTGYPMQLVGDQIPLCARIVSLVDVFDALVSARPYKKPFSVNESLEIISQSKYTKFDPRIVDTFITHIDLFKSIMIEYQ